MESNKTERVRVFRVIASMLVGFLGWRIIAGVSYFSVGFLCSIDIGGFGFVLNAVNAIGMPIGALYSARGICNGIAGRSRKRTAGQSMIVLGIVLIIISAGEIVSVLTEMMVYNNFSSVAQAWGAIIASVVYLIMSIILLSSGKDKKREIGA